MRRLLILACGCIAASPALAEVSIHSPRPDAVSLTIYRDGMALVTETRHVELPAGAATLVFEGVVDSLLPRSAVMDGAGRPLQETDFRFDQLTPAALLRASVGKEVTIVRTSPRSGVATRLQATIVSADHGVVLRSMEGNEALYCAGLPERLEFSAVPGELVRTPTLSVHLAAGAAGPRTITISYLAHGFSWSADYVAQLNKTSSRMDLAGWATLSNETGASFTQARVQLVAGRLNLLADAEGGSRPRYSNRYGGDELDENTGQPMTNFARLREEQQDAIDADVALLHGCFPLARSSDGPLADNLSRSLAAGAANGRLADLANELSEVQVTGSRIINREQLGDYQLYRLPWPTDLNARQTKQAAFLHNKGVKVERFYSVQLPYLEAPQTYPDYTPAVMLKWQNTRAAGLGEPLPAGQLRIFETQPGGQVFAGEASITDKPVGLPVEVTIARALDLVSEFKLDDSRENRESGRRFTTIQASHRFVNNKNAPVNVEVRRPDRDGRGTTVVVSSNLPARRERGELVWRFRLPAGQEQQLRYELKAEERRD